MTNDLFLAILAMDSYNRGYDPGMEVTRAQIGNATLGLRSTDSAAGTPGGQAAGFYAISYTWNGQTVISYRGTDDVLGLGDGASDLWRGWITGAGHLVPGGQAQLAVDFYNNVTGANVIAGASGSGAIIRQTSMAMWH